MISFARFSVSAPAPRSMSRIRDAGSQDRAIPDGQGVVTRSKPNRRSAIHSEMVGPRHQFPHRPKLPGSREHRVRGTIADRHVVVASTEHERQVLPTEKLALVVKESPARRLG